MTGCRIGKVKLKKGGADIHIIKTDDRPFKEKPEEFSNAIGKNAAFVGFFVMDKDGVMYWGHSNIGGLYPSQIMGALERFKQGVMNDMDF